MKPNEDYMCDRVARTNIIYSKLLDGINSSQWCIAERELAASWSERLPSNQWAARNTSLDYLCTKVEHPLTVASIPYPISCGASRRSLAFFYLFRCCVLLPSFIMLSRGRLLSQPRLLFIDTRADNSYRLPRLQCVTPSRTQNLVINGKFLPWPHLTQKTPLKNCMVMF